MSRHSRREFLRGTVAAGVVAGHPRSLGNAGVKVTRLAFGTGSFGGRVQRELGRERFTRLVRYACERGIRFFESADAYDGMHEMLAIALRGLPRDSYRLMTKYRLREAESPRATIDRVRRELESEYFDVLRRSWVRASSGRPSSGTPPSAS
jgi:aryl-alcohol dehydrogenase-like predicted oxidoreductase